MPKEIVPSSERKFTNIGALNAAGVLLGLTLILVILCGIVSVNNSKSIDQEDVSVIQQRRVLMDDCGNVCGENNTGNSQNCEASNKLQFPKLLILKNGTNDDENSEKFYSSQCVSQCPVGYDDISNICIAGIESDFTRAMRILKASWYCIMIMCIIATVVSFLFLSFFRYAAKCAILFTNIGFIFMCFASFVFYAVPGFYGYATPFLIFGIGLTIYLVLIRDKIELVACLFEKSSKILIEVPFMSCVPIMTLSSLAVVSSIYIVFLKIIGQVDEENPLSQMTYWFNTVSYLFIIQFIIGCQNFVIAGVVCRWFFTRSKVNLKSPFKKSFADLFRFHLGSVCVGAFLMTIIKLFRRTAKVVRGGLVLINAENLLDGLLEKVFIYLCSNAYVIVAKEGTPFADSGTRAYKLLKNNIKKVFTLNTLGDVSLFSCKMLTTYIAGCVGYFVLIKKADEFGDLFTLPLIIGCILAFLITRCLILVFEMTVDAFFICTCIDLEENISKNKESYTSESMEALVMKFNEGELSLSKNAAEDGLDVEQTIV